MRSGIGPARHLESFDIAVRGTARVGNDDNAVVDSRLRVRGVENLRVADASVLPRVTSGNTMAPCVAIGYQAARLI